jgi:histidinol-phosphatase (PHP family)
MTSAEAAKAAREKNIGIAFTEHLDFECDSDLVCMPDDWSGYLEINRPLRSQGVLLGLEIGLTVNTRALGRKASCECESDFVIGSVHVVEGRDIFTDFFSQDLPAREIYRKYLKCTLAVIENCAFFDSLGHIDYPSRYSPFPVKNIEYHEFKLEYGEIFTALLDYKKALEINTSRLNDVDFRKNASLIMKGFSDCGGSLVTIGSDAHRACDLGRNLEAGYEIAAENSLSPVYFREREAFPIQL